MVLLGWIDDWVVGRSEVELMLPIDHTSSRSATAPISCVAPKVVLAMHQLN